MARRLPLFEKASLRLTEGSPPKTKILYFGQGSQWDAWEKPGRVTIEYHDLTEAEVREIQQFCSQARAERPFDCAIRDVIIPDCRIDNRSPNVHSEEGKRVVFVRLIVRNEMTKESLDSRAPG